MSSTASVPVASPTLATRVATGMPAASSASAVPAVATIVKPGLDEAAGGLDARPPCRGRPAT